MEPAPQAKYGQGTGSVAVALKPSGSKNPIFAVPAAGSTVFGFFDVARHLAPNQPMYAFQPRGFRRGEQPHDRIEQMAVFNIEAMRQIQPAGPYVLGGQCLGAVVAFEMAQRLHAAGQEVSFVGLFGMLLPPGQRRGLTHYARLLFNMCRDGEVTHFIREEVRRRRALRSYPLARQVLSAHARAGRQYQPSPYPGRITLFWACQRTRVPDYRKGWEDLARDGLDYCVVPGSNNTMLHEPYVQAFADRLQQTVSQTQPAGA